MSSIQDVADYMISNTEGDICHKQLHKLLYFAQGFYLAEYGESLFDEDMQAWDFGPVNGSIWGRFKSRGYLPLPKPENPTFQSLNQQKKAFLVTFLAVFLAYGQQQLIDMSHVDYPWEKNYIHGLNATLPKEEIRDFFSSFEGFEDYLNVTAQKVEFSKLLNARRDYLIQLVDIGSDWISGKASPPTKEVCNISSKLLTVFEKRFFTNLEKVEIPNLLMGPIPSGGVCIEFHSVAKNVYFQFHNDGLTEISIEREGDFEEIELQLTEFNEEIAAYLEGIV